MPEAAAAGDGSRLLLLGLLFRDVEVVGRAELLLVLDQRQGIEEHGDAHVREDVAVQYLAVVAHAVARVGDDGSEGHVPGRRDEAQVRLDGWSRQRF